MINSMAVVTFMKEGSKDQITGVITAPIYIARNLRRYIDKVDVISVRDSYRVQPKFWDDNNVLSGNTDLLNQYDHVLFITAGEYYTIKQYNRDKERGPKGISYAESKYPHVLDGLNVPFTLMTADEQDSLIYAYFFDFINHPMCRGIMYLGEGMRDTVDLTPDGLSSFIVPPMLPLSPIDEIIMKVKSKPTEKKIISLSRWIPCKRIREYLTLVKEGKFKEYNISAEIASTPVSTYYIYTDLYPSGLTDKIGTILPEIDILSHGSYEPLDLPGMLKDITYSWDFLYYKHGGRFTTMTPRIQQVSIEALNEGVLPVVCKQYTPDWLLEDGVLRLDRSEESEIPKILGTMSIDERIDRLIRFHESLDIHMTKYYEDYISEISR